MKEIKRMNSQKVVTPVKTGVQMSRNYLKTLDSDFRRNDEKWCFSTFCETIKENSEYRSSITAVIFFMGPQKDRQIYLSERAAKFYLFDVGVAGAITKRHIEEEKGELFGKAFEHFIFMEIAAYNSYNEIDYEINFWRTKSGLEVDFVLGRGEVAIEVKGGSRIGKRDLQPLNAFIDEYSPRSALVVCNEREERVHGRIRIMPYRNFLRDLWEGKIIH